MKKIIASCICKIGKKRENNEDNFYFAGKILNKKNRGMLFQRTVSTKLRNRTLFGVFDGMGGEECGETASYLAAKTVKKNTGVNVDEIIQMANRSVCAFAADNAIGVMGSTLAIAEFGDEGVSVYNLGDSRAYIYDRGFLEQISEDHNEAAFFAESGIQGRKPRLTQHLGISEEEMRLVPSVTHKSFSDFKYLLICSDGLTDMVDDEGIRAVIEAQRGAKNITKALYSVAMANGGKDNITIIVCEVI